MTTETTGLPLVPHESSSLARRVGLPLCASPSMEQLNRVGRGSESLQPQMSLSP